MIILYYNYYLSDKIERQKELDYCFFKNLENPSIDRIYLILTRDTSLPIDSPKVIKIFYEDRPTFRLLHDHIRENSGNDDINILINSDCFLDYNDMPYLKKRLSKGDVWALNRWDIVDIEKFNARHYNYEASQDCWIFYNTKKDPIENIDFKFGIPGCDNRIAYELDKNKFHVINPSQNFRVYHYHLSKIRTYVPTVRVPGPYKYIKSTSL
jgi:hypothetical protein